MACNQNQLLLFSKCEVHERSRKHGDSLPHLLKSFTSLLLPPSRVPSLPLANGKLDPISLHSYLKSPIAPPASTNPRSNN
ncbi:hypothetical protein L1987_39037 [Smallanthus sonchifolius]|uniref:Uncharacterized protein n=1 Tax=Smallanthus sonchifolius TaxID=185202 RepID=A0ACB9HL72_9ASTR|nr:hypothetical protein L1987_39037 [Smallanthus sonchifolius]